MAENEYKAVRSKHAWFDYRGIEDELTRMAAQGWELDYISANRLSWVYKKSEPRDLQFAVVFCKDSSNFLYNPPDSQRTLEAYCEAGGWKQVEQCNKMIIFAAEKGTARPLETDEAVRLESIRQSMNRQYGISLIIMVLGLVLCIWRTFSSAGLNVHEDWFIANANLIYVDIRSVFLDMVYRHFHELQDVAEGVSKSSSERRRAGGHREIQPDISGADKTETAGHTWGGNADNNKDDNKSRGNMTPAFYQSL